MEINAATQVVSTGILVTGTDSLSLQFAKIAESVLRHSLNYSKQHNVRCVCLQHPDLHQVSVYIFTGSFIIVAPPDLDIISGGCYESIEPAVALTTLVPFNSAPCPIPEWVIPGCLSPGINYETTLTVVVLPNKVW